MVDIQFTLTQEEYVEAQNLYSKPGRKRRWIKWALCIILLVSLVTVFWNSPRQAFSQTSVPLVTLLLVLMFATSLPALRASVFRKRYKREVRNLRNARLILDDDGYHVTVPGIGGGVAEWEGMDEWLEGKLVFVIKTGFSMRTFRKRHSMKFN